MNEYNAGVKEEMKLSNENRLASAIMAERWGHSHLIQECMKVIN